MNIDCDVAVVGGGVVGMSVTHGLSARGLSVVVLDEGDLAFRASRGNFALIWVQSKGLSFPPYARWSRRSAGLWPAFADKLRVETGIDLALSQRGGLTACLSEVELEARATDQRRLHNEAPDCEGAEVLDRAAMARLVPQIGPEVVGGLYGRHDGHVNSLRLFDALHESARRRGVRYVPNAPVERIAALTRGFALEAAQGTVRAGKVVLAAGLGNARLAPMVGLAAPVRPERGQILVTEKLAPFLDLPFVNIRQTDEGGVLIGDSKEEVGFDAGSAQRVVAGIAANAVRILPVLARLQVVRSWGALRVMSADGFPIYDASPGCPGAFVVTCHSGVTLAAAHARDIAGAIAGEAWPDSLLPFSARRFDDVQAAA